MHACLFNFVVAIKIKLAGSKDATYLFKCYLTLPILEVFSRFLFPSKNQAAPPPIKYTLYC